MEALEHASLIRPCQGESVSGDATVIRPIEVGLFLAIIDVLGHGPEAHDLARVIEQYLERYGDADIAGVMKRLHDHVRGSRGAAVGLCALDTTTGRVVYTGTGNTVVRRMGPVDTRLVSHDGIVGQNIRTPRPQSLRLEEGDLLLLYTDGVSDRFTAEDYPGIRDHAPKDVVRTVIQRFGKSYDDAACIAVRYQP